MTERPITHHDRAVIATGLAFALGLVSVTLLAGGDPPSVRQEEAVTATSTTAPPPATVPNVAATVPPAPPATTVTTTPAAAPPPQPAPARRAAPVVTSPPVPVPPPATSPLAGAWLAAGARNVAASTAPVPVRIEIPKIGVTAPVDPLGLNADGTMQVPEDFSRTGWYTGRPVPGEVGPSVIIGHVDSRRGPAVFYRLRQLDPGAEVIVHRADRSAVTFVVERSKQVPKREFPTDEVYGPTAGPTLRLVTCGGTFDRRSGHYRDNTIVFLRMKG